jgi:glycosyltransferase involved in cell wall biosynthesis
MAPTRPRASNRLRVLHVSPYFAPAFVYGGPPRSILGLCAALAAAGAEIDVMTTTANGPHGDLPPVTEDPQTIDGVRVRYFPLAVPRALWRAPLLRDALTREIHRYDVLHVHGLWHSPGWFAAGAARTAGVPYVVSPRGMLEPEALAISRHRKAVAFRLIEKANLTSAACLHATSSREAATLERRAFGPRILMAPNGVAIDAVALEARRQVLSGFGLGETDRYVLFLGRVHPIKRLDLLAAAAARLRARDVTIVIAGPDENGHRATIEPLFAASGLRTVWTGAVEGVDKAALLGGARALVLCSDSESFGMSAAEALAAGAPVVATTTCPWEELETEGAGRWVAHTPEAIASALDGILADADAAKAMGGRGADLARRRYTWSANARLVAATYEQLVAGRLSAAGVH